VNRSQVLLFGLTTAVMSSGYGVMFTVLDDFRDEYGIQAEWLGLIVGVGFFSSFIAQIFLAPIADRGHARALVVGGVLMNVVGLLVMAFGESLIPLLAGRLVSGIGIGMAFPAIRRIVVNGDPDNLGNNLGLLLAADVAGFAAGPALSAIMVPSLGLSAPFLTIAGLAILCLPVILRVQFAGDAVAGDAVAGDAGPRFAFDLLRLRPMVAALMMGACLFLMIGTFDALWAVVLDDLDASEFVANAGISIFALPLVIFGAYGGRLAQRIGPFRLGPLGLIIGAGCIFLYGFMPTGILMLVVGSVHALNDGLTASCTAVAVGMVAPADRQAGAQGMLGAAETLTGGITAVLAGVLYSWGGRVLAYTTCSVIMIVLAVSAYVVAGPEYRARRSVEPPPLVDPVSAVTGHA
jgi:MFS family permease